MFYSTKWVFNHEPDTQQTAYRDGHRESSHSLQDSEFRSNEEAANQLRLADFLARPAFCVCQTQPRKRNTLNRDFRFYVVIMGKRKKSTRKPQGKKKNEPLPTNFTCLFCNHEKAVQVKLHKKTGFGDLMCTVCGQNFQCAINYLSDPVDVYSEWVDAADAVAKQQGGSASSARPSRPRYQQTDREVEDGEDERRYEGEGIVGDDDEY
ncbi:transcription elongation factor Elf1 like-domain-containing protein [Xylariaceae sp. FL0016]|nr:transcription elongation factor Elf1 like-domain-containing protein [Xylariaceae sp. FL0016]